MASHQSKSQTGGGEILEVDLECLIDNEGTEWADADEDLPSPSSRDNEVGSCLTVGRASTSWAGRVAAEADALVSGQPADSNCVGTSPLPGKLSLASFPAGPTIQHKAEVPPIFLAYKCISNEGQHISLVQIATAFIQAVGQENKLDAVQPMKAGWYIYMHTLKDRATLVEKGITLAGRYILLQSETCPESQRSVKVTLKDLPLHSVENVDVLAEMKNHCSVTSAVQYSNIWYNGKATNIRNGDRYIYVDDDDVAKIPDQLHVGTYLARVFKPVGLSRCKRCGNEGHQLSDPNCPARADESMMDSVDTF